jgi:hypothetical protein
VAVESEYFKIFGVIGVLTLVLQVGTACWERWVDTDWRGVYTPTTLWQILAEWAIFMVLFFLLFLVVHSALVLTCVVCNLN